MRIDEFSAIGTFDGVLSSVEQSSFLLFGFDIQLSEFTGSLWRELLIMNSAITTSFLKNSQITKDFSLNSPILTNITLNSGLG